MSPRAAKCIVCPVQLMGGISYAAYASALFESIHIELKSCLLSSYFVSHRFGLLSGKNRWLGSREVLFLGHYFSSDVPKDVLVKNISDNDHSE